MGTNQVLFWLVSSGIVIAVGWWLAARQRVRVRSITVPLTAVIVVLSVLALLLSATGTDFREFLLDVRVLTS
jgi:uncharacterized membrane protein YccF (DUF307 family)